MNDQEDGVKRAVVVGAVGSTEILLKALNRSPDWRTVMLVTLPDELSRRHSDFVDLAPLAEEGSATIHRTAKSDSADTRSAIKAAEPDYIFVVGWSQLCGPDFLALKPDGIIGYHPAALPRLRGRAAIPWTILLDEKITAGSLFWLGEGTDDGDLLTQEYFHLAPDETAETLYAKHMSALEAMLGRVLPQLATGEEPRIVQDDRYATWAAKRTPADGLIDWSRSAVEIDRLIRAVGRPYPGAFTHAAGERLTVWQSHLLHGDNPYHAGVGQIVSKTDDALVVQTGEGLLALTDWDLDGNGPLRLHARLGD